MYIKHIYKVFVHILVKVHIYFIYGIYIYISVYIYPQKKIAETATSKNEIWNSFGSALQHPFFNCGKSIMTCTCN